MSLKHSFAPSQQEIKLNQIPLSKLLSKGGKEFIHNTERENSCVTHDIISLKDIDFELNKNNNLLKVAKSTSPMKFC